MGYPACGALGVFSKRKQSFRNGVAIHRKGRLCQPAKLEIEGFYRGLGVVKGEAKVLLSFVASQTMIYIVFAVTLLICQKSAPLPT